MKLLNFVHGTADKTVVKFDTEYTTELLYDEFDEASYEVIDITELVWFKGRRYIIDDVRTFEEGYNAIAHRYDNTRGLKHELYLLVDWDANEYYYELKKWKL